MRHLTLIIMFGWPALLSADEGVSSIVFAKADLGKAPANWEITQTNEGKASVWKVVEDASTPSKSGYALAQLAEGPRSVFNLCVLKDSQFKDGEVSVRFKSITGDIDQGGGVVWRYKDAGNYYVARYNPLELNYRVYKLVDGRRIQLASEDGFELPEGKWHELSIRHEGTRMVCSLNGKPMLRVEDDTFTEAGRVGLWTKADAQTQFDLFRFTKD